MNIVPFGLMPDLHSSEQSTGYSRKILFLTSLGEAVSKYPCMEVQIK